MRSRERAQRVGHRLEWLVAANRARRRDTASLQKPDDDEHRLLRLALLARLVVGEEVEMRDADRYNEVDCDRAVEAHPDLIAETSGAGGRVGDDKKPTIRVEGGRWIGGADTHTRERKRCHDAQSGDDGGHDREPDPAERRRTDYEGGHERRDDEDRGERSEDERD